MFVYGHFTAEKYGVLQDAEISVLSEAFVFDIQFPFL